jgi:PAS domain S-box-containing protein
MTPGGDSYRHLFAVAPQPAWVVDVETLRILDANRAAVAHYGRPSADTAAANFTDLLVPDEVQKFLLLVAHSAAVREWSGRWRHRVAGGATIDVDVRAEPIEFGGRSAALVVADDVTERVRTDAAVRQSEARYRAVVDNIKQVIFQADARGAWTFLNSAWTDITGFGVRESLGTSFLRYVHPDDRQAHAEAFQPLVEQRGEYFGHVARYVTKAGGYRWLEVFAQLVLDEAGGVQGIFGTLTDITERKRAEEELTAARARLHHLLVASPAVVSASEPTPDFPITFIGANVARQLGWAVQEVLDDPRFWVTRIHPEDRVRVLKTLWPLVASGVPDDRQAQEYRFLAGDGTWRWIHDERRVVRDESDRPVEIVASWVDVTDQRRAEDERLRLSSVVEQSAEAIVITGADGTIEYVNAAYERLTGCARAELSGRRAPFLGDLAPTGDRYPGMQETLLTGSTWSGALTGHRKDGTPWEAEGVVSPVKDATGRVVNYVAGMHDLTRQRQIEDELRQAQKMELAGRLAGGIAHDFNNILTIISGRGHLLLRKVTQDDPLRTDVQLITEAAQRATALTRQLLIFSRKQTVTPRRLDVGAVVGNMEKMLRRLIGEDVDLVTRLAPDLSRVMADAGQIEQVIMNLAVNARDAMPLGGRLTIETANVLFDAADARRPVSLTPGPYVMLKVRDTGYGIAPDVVPHIFEPFFTTKSPDKGTGLGLSTVYGIVKHSGGEVVVESAPESGATFRVYLPTVTPRRDGAESPARGVVSARGSETLLLVEDEDDVRALASEILQSSGYTVLEARHGNDALAVSSCHPGRIDLLLTDVVMPQLGGPELAERLLRLRPDTRVLFMSGYTDDMIHRRVASQGFPLLDKPFSPEALTRKVREALEPPGDVPAPADTAPTVGD